jgi:hypothetical protein
MNPSYCQADGAVILEEQGEFHRYTPAASLPRFFGCGRRRNLCWDIAHNLGEEKSKGMA